MRKKRGNMQESTNLKEEFLSPSPTTKPWNLLQETEGWKETQQTAHSDLSNVSFGHNSPPIPI